MKEDEGLARRLGEVQNWRTGGAAICSACTAIRARQTAVDVDSDVDVDVGMSLGEEGGRRRVLEGGDWSGWLVRWLYASIYTLYRCVLRDQATGEGLNPKAAQTERAEPNGCSEHSEPSLRTTFKADPSLSETKST